MNSNIKTFEDACVFMGTTPEAVLPALVIPHLSSDEIAYRKLKVIVAAINKEENGGVEWTPDWNNTNGTQWKHYPWMEIAASPEQPSGSGVSYFDCDRVISTSAVGSRLCYLSEEGCQYGATQFEDVYCDFFLIK
ncbi:MAG: hypothetical protein WC760_02840 [Bacteroidia bacterium]|jgi:hypothetical protein